MSSFVARGNYDPKKKKKERETTVSAASIAKYEDRGHSARSISGTKTKSRPGGGPKKKDKKAEAVLGRLDERRKDAALQAAEAEILETEDGGFVEAEGMERTYKFKQSDLKPHLDEQTAAQQYDLNLDSYAPYVHSYTRSGRHLLLAGRGGHVAVMDALTRTLLQELHLTDNGSTRNDVRGCTFLHGEWSCDGVSDEKATASREGGGLHAARSEARCLLKTSLLMQHRRFAPLSSPFLRISFSLLSHLSLLAAHR